jgi:hypothetical protein
MQIPKNFRLLCLFLALGTLSLHAHAQRGYWQQRVEYSMDIKMDVTTHQFTGEQKLVYFNHSPDTLHRVFYHLYFNAFQPGSAMDVRSRTIADPDPRVASRIAELKDDEIGYQHIKSLKQDGKVVSYRVDGTILEVTLQKPILPNTKAVFDMEFAGQVPIQIRRSGRDSREGISYSMAQWYPKMCEYDHEGWHANPYIGREFHGVWGDFDVKITIDSRYILGGTGYLQNADKIGYGYEKKGTQVKRSGDKLTWHFKAPNVHDFMWGADPDYVHTTAQVTNGPTLHFFHDPKTANKEAWAKLPEYTVKAFEYMNKNFGVYPYEQFSVVQGGDGGMEYPMSTLITGNRNLRSLVGVTVHELVHSWFQGVLATNESLYGWMDEGFTTFATDLTMHHLFGEDASVNPHSGSYNSYVNLVKSGLEEPMSTHADRFITNRAYGTSSYSKGSVFLNQLGYIIGQETLMRGMRRYYNTWKFKHPTPTDLMRIMEKESGIELHWYFQEMINTTNTIDYAFSKVVSDEKSTYITLERKQQSTMPIDLLVEYTDGTMELIYIPLRIMRGQKKVEYMNIPRTTRDAWPWVNPTYVVEIKKPLKEIKYMEIDPSKRMADIDRTNNVFVPGQEMMPFADPTR